MRDIIIILLITLIAILTVFSAACSQPAGASLLTDDSGANLTMIAIPKRIVSLAPSNTEIVYALGLQDKLVGVTEYCNFPPEAKSKTRVGGFSTVDIEKTVSLQPDLILAADIHSKSATPALQKVGFNVLTLNPKTLRALLNDITLVGTAMGQATRTEALTGELERRINAVPHRVESIKPEERPRVLLLLWHDPVMAAGGGTLIDNLITTAGGNNIAGDLAGHQNFSLEVLLSRNPQVIVIPASMGSGENPLWNYINTEPRLKSVSAVANGRLYRIDGDIIYRYGPRAVLGLEQLAGFIHPHLFNSGK
jgi:iron complex transport system substrate-binding protein